MKVSINIVTWNSSKYLPDCLLSIFNQTFGDFSVLVIDNNSTDGTCEFLEKEYGDRLQLVKNQDNQGFAKAHNQGIEIARQNGAEFVLVANSDIILKTDFLEKLVHEADMRLDVASFGGKLLRVTDVNEKNALDPFNKEEKNIPLTPFVKGELKKDNIVDSAGLKIFKNRRVVEIGAGEKDVGQYNKKQEVFGVSAALALYRVKALEEVRIDSQTNSQKFANQFASVEYFDNDFFAYKEDVDLAWRLQLAGWKSLYIPEATAHHYRGATSKEKIGNFGTVDIRRGKSQLINYLSYRNNLLMLLKNDYFSNFLIDSLRIFWYELRKIVYILFCEIKSLKAWIDFFRLIPRMRQKRKFIINKAKVGRREIRRWFK